MVLKNEQFYSLVSTITSPSNTMTDISGAQQAVLAKSTFDTSKLIAVKG